MKEVHIKNEHVEAIIACKGAELKALFVDGKNFIWSIDETYWNKTSPLLFPIVGALKQNTYTYQGKEYSLPRHGFARDYEFSVLQQTDDAVVFSLLSNESTLSVYPFAFELLVSYRLTGKKIQVTYTVKNPANTDLYFSIGAHPAFAIDGDFSSYSLEFDNDQPLERHLLENEVFSGEKASLPLKNAVLDLQYALFEKDAIVLKEEATKSLTVLKEGVPKFKVEFGDFPYLGIWTKENAPFICIEPWLGIADNADATGILEDKEGIQKLSSGEVVEKVWSIEVF